MESNNFRLKISNYFKIRNADIMLDGITVISGESPKVNSLIAKTFFELIGYNIEYEYKIVRPKLSAGLKRVLGYFESINRDLVRSLESKTRIPKIKLESTERSERLWIAEVDKLVLFCNLHFDMEHRIPIGGNASSKKMQPDGIYHAFSKRSFFNGADIEDYNLTEMFDHLKKHINLIFIEYKIMLLKYESSLVYPKLQTTYKMYGTPDSIEFFQNGVPVYKSSQEIVKEISNVNQIGYWSVEYYLRASPDDLKRNIKNYLELDELFGNLFEEVFTKQKIEWLQLLKEETLIDYLENSYRKDKKFSAGDIFLKCYRGYKRDRFHSRRIVILEKLEEYTKPEYYSYLTRLIILLNKIYGMKFIILTNNDEIKDQMLKFAREEEVDESIHIYEAQKIEKDKFDYVPVIK